ncbi:hypothetical protein QJS10_CPB11g00239 [Acorus calamus]|uniref:Uncharacterized protein n=1 Tax=Acorus calamus TaxID=4465 RepID=A0AAV9DTN4_ACOCL|nr:hypothetical protein QJS10_CPB11g00239 [Acorus calamus]
MENKEKLRKFSSYRGVSFEIQPSKNSPFSAPPAGLPGRWVWLPQTSGRSFKFFSLSDSSSDIHRFMTHPSSHFCDAYPNQTSLEKSIETLYNSIRPRPLHYKRFFLLSFTLNATLVSLAASGRFDYAKRHAALFAMANILTLSHSEAFLRLLFSLSVVTLHRLPLPLKTAATSFL